MKLAHLFVATIALAMTPFAAPAAVPDEANAKSTIKTWVDDFNRGDLKAFVAKCAPHAAVLDGFPPYAWTSCDAWMSAYASNSKAIMLTEGRLSIDEPVSSFFDGDRGYLVYPATFSDRENGKPVVYVGTWTITLKKVANRWLVTGSGSNWGGDYVVKSKP